MLGKIFLSLFYLIMAILVIACHYSSDTVYNVGVSSDGNYAITVNDAKVLTLWNIANKTSTRISRNVNPYSISFVKGTHDFIWQNKNKEVFVTNSKAQNILHFYNEFFVVSQMITPDLKNYFFINQYRKLFRVNAGKQEALTHYLPEGDILQRVVGVAFNKGKNVLVTLSGVARFPDDSSLDSLSDARYTHIIWWDMDAGKPIFIIPIADQDISDMRASAVSPDSRYVMVGNYTDALGWMFDQMNSINLGKLYEKSYYQLMPNDFGGDDSVSSFKFIDKHLLLRFADHFPGYAILYNLDSLQPVKYIKLDGAPQEQFDNKGMDSAPEAHVLVMGQKNGPGIVVYRYSPRAQTLTKIWSPNFGIIFDYLYDISDAINGFFIGGPYIALLTVGLVPLVLYGVISLIIIAFLRKKAFLPILIFIILTWGEGSYIYSHFNDCEEMGQLVCQGEGLFLFSLLIGALLPYLWLYVFCKKDAN